jgi:ABC-type spermidine/putrescine transport system permease subunit II
VRLAAFADLAWRGFAALVVVFMAAPLILVVLFSFNASALTSLPLTGFTLDWYRRLFANASFWPALRNSLVVGFAVALASVASGTLAALALSRARKGPANALMAALGLPVLLPALVVGVALVCYFVRFRDLRLGLPTVILGRRRSWPSAPWCCRSSSPPSSARP